MKKYLRGIILCVLIASFSTYLSNLKINNFSLEIIGAPVISIIIGIIIISVFSHLTKNSFSYGIKFCSKKVLQWAVVILGFSLNLFTIIKVGTKSLPIIVTTILVALLVSIILIKLLKINKKTGILVGVGSSICGGSAIAATAPVIKADEEEVAQSISVIFLFNILAALIFPTFGKAIGLSSEGFAIFAGTAINDTSSVTAASSVAENLYKTSILSSAVTVKLTRTIAIIPITIILAIIVAKKQKKDDGNFSIKKVFPFFIIYFVLAALLTTIIGIVPKNDFTVFYNEHFLHFSKMLAKFFIAVAMAAIGLNTNIVKLVKSGGKPILQGFICFILITATSLTLQYLFGSFSV